jgi:hypothetical protein
VARASARALWVWCTRLIPTDGSGEPLLNCPQPMQSASSVAATRAPNTPKADRRQELPGAVSESARAVAALDAHGEPAGEVLSRRNDRHGLFVTARVQQPASKAWIPGKQPRAATSAARTRLAQRGGWPPPKNPKARRSAVLALLDAQPRIARRHELIRPVLLHDLP